MMTSAPAALSAVPDTRAPDGASTSDGPAALLGHAAVVIWNDIVPERREEFFRWHENEHIPERLALPGFRRGRRFVRAGHSPEWLTIYEADSLDALTSPEYLARLNSPTPATTHTLTYFRNTSRAVCRLVHSVGSSTGGHMLAMRVGVERERSDAMCQAVRDELFPAAVAITGVLACHLLKSDESASFINTAESNTRAFDVPSWVVLVEATSERAANEARRAIEGAALQSLGAVVRGDAAVYALEICRLSRRT